LGHLNLTETTSTIIAIEPQTDAQTRKLSAKLFYQAGFNPGRCKAAWRTAYGKIGNGLKYNHSNDLNNQLILIKKTKSNL